MERSFFEYNGHNSLDFHLTILNDVSFPSPESDIEFVEVLGRDGDVAIDNQRLKGVDISLPVALIPPKGISTSDLATKVSEWLKNDVGWHALRLSSVYGYEYTAMLQAGFNVEQMLRQYGETVLTFRVKPYKRRISQQSINFTSSTTLINPEQRQSKPLIEVEGEGDITLQNNGKDWLVLKGVDGRITVDSDLMSVYKDNLPQFDKMASHLRPLFPILHDGENNLTATGNITEIIIEPRWEAVV